MLFKGTRKFSSEYAVAGKIKPLEQIDRQRAFDSYLVNFADCH